jgi:P27 family predicted phage terminase small subunit
VSAHLRGVKPALRADADALTKAPIAPKHLTAHGRTEWRNIMPQLIERRVITKADLSGVATYCGLVGTIRQIEENQAATGEIDLKMMGLAVRCATTARQLASEYGLTPTSRARIGATADDDQDHDNPLSVK